MYVAPHSHPLSDALGASWSSPLTPLTEARGYLVMACSTEQLHRTKRQMANVLSQAAATNRTFVEPGVASSFVVEPWGARVSTCGTRAAGGARLYWDLPRYFSGGCARATPSTLLRRTL